MMNLGIMQGRLLPSFKSNYQAHPINYWQKEFLIAKEIGLKSIEFIVDAYLYADNPILNEKGLNEIKNLILESEVTVRSICADIFMEWPIQKIVKSEKNIYIELILKMIENLSEIGGKDIVIPFVDNSSIKNDKEKEFIVDFFNNFKNIVKEKDINICIESDLDPYNLKKFIESFNNEKIKINYDSGNSASLGYKFDEEIALYKEKISNIHIKDRIYGGGPVPLGKGDAEIKKVKNFIISENYNGTITFQAYRDKNQVQTFLDQYNYFLNL